ncbi:hypothetical protein HPB50_005518 [Hyalomma asiaticum]|uniref:Uncharacterized protein n=1 Tax=Hyalomma asiaticum TaxID=266040 RepID=A0ACB7S495_HYAAI|nr:hypothetical protein HPB50_005518 [Hyalomma asiaticum]
MDSGKTTAKNVLLKLPRADVSTVVLGDSQTKHIYQHFDPSRLDTPAFITQRGALIADAFLLLNFVPSTASTILLHVGTNDLASCSGRPAFERALLPVPLLPALVRVPLSSRAHLFSTTQPLTFLPPEYLLEALMLSSNPRASGTQCSRSKVSRALTTSAPTTVYHALAEDTRYNLRKKRPDTLHTSIVNLSDFTLTHEDESALSHGLNFSPASGGFNEFQLLKDLENFARNMRLKEYFHDRPKDPERDVSFPKRSLKLSLQRTTSRKQPRISPMRSQCSLLLRVSPMHSRCCLWQRLTRTHRQCAGPLRHGSRPNAKLNHRKFILHLGSHRDLILEGRRTIVQSVILAALPDTAPAFADVGRKH